jgi:RHS repeat-associated protein
MGTFTDPWLQKRCDVDGDGSVTSSDVDAVDNEVYYGPPRADNDSPGLHYTTLGSHRTGYYGGVSGAVLCEFGHQGLMHDEELGNDKQHNRARYKNGKRFMQRDPLEYVDGMALYTYVTSSPLQCVDPFGLWEKGNGGIGGTGLGGGHGNFPGGNDLNYPLEDEGPTGPISAPERHFRPLAQSEADARTAISKCNRDAFQRALHRGQDYFSHYRPGYRWNPGGGQIGHVVIVRSPFWNWPIELPGSDPDGAVQHWDDYQAAADWTRKMLDEWNEHCCDKIDPSPGWIPPSQEPPNIPFPPGWGMFSSP